MCIKPQVRSVILEAYVEQQSDTREFNTINWCQALGVIWINGAGSKSHTQTHTQERRQRAHKDTQKDVWMLTEE